MLAVFAGVKIDAFLPCGKEDLVALVERSAKNWGIVYTTNGNVLKIRFVRGPVPFPLAPFATLVANNEDQGVRLTGRLHLPLVLKVGTALAFMPLVLVAIDFVIHSSAVIAFAGTVMSIAMVWGLSVVLLKRGTADARKWIDKWREGSAGKG